MNPADPLPSSGHAPQASRLSRLAPMSLLFFAVLTVIAGQATLELFTMDDLREAEIAREMLDRGDFVLTTLAGRSYVEKPPGFYIIIALAYRFTGGPSTLAARLVSTAFALSCLAAVYLLGKRASGALGGGIAALALASSMLFCRIAHTVLLDIALAASLAWALHFTWSAMVSEPGRRKRNLHALALFAVGIAFLFKGFVGPALFGSGMLVYLILSRRWGECRWILHPVSIVAFLIPFLAWVIPFVIMASRDLIYEFAITHHFGRALHAYDSHPRPLYFYWLTLWEKFAPGSLLLPFAAVQAWRSRRQPGEAAGLFFLSAALGPGLLLSLSSAKDNAYLLAAYPALACLVAGWWIEKQEAQAVSSRVVVRLFWGTSVLFVAGLLGLTWHFGRVTAAGVCGALGLASAAALGGISFRNGNTGLAAWSAAALLTLGVILCCEHPIATRYLAQLDPKPALRILLAVAGDRRMFLLQPDDRLRGGCGFLRGRTAEEILSPRVLVAKLKEDPRSVAVVPSDPRSTRPTLLAELAQAGVRMEVLTSVELPGPKVFDLIRALPLPSSTDPAQPHD
jgi:4-amino-4-deoxy-L-arabinose transferase-like glycosyltransferase